TSYFILRTSNLILSLIERQKLLRIRWPDVLRARTNQAIVRVLLEHVRGPAGDPADGEDRRVEIDGNPERVEHRRRVEVDVGVQALLALDERFDALGHRVPLGH